MNSSKDGLMNMGKPIATSQLCIFVCSNKHRPIYSLILGSEVIIVLSSDAAVKELIDKRSSIYSSRPEMYLAQKICSGGLRFSLMVRSVVDQTAYRYKHGIIPVDSSSLTHGMLLHL